MVSVAVAVSPDGSKVAIAGNGPETAAGGDIPACRLRDARIVVIDLRTGWRAVFAGRGSTASPGPAAAGRWSTWLSVANTSMSASTQHATGGSGRSPSCG
jgi:hypothetical protein